MVEFAIVFPVFLIFVFALIELGRAMMVTSLLTNAARVAVRGAILSGKSDSDITTSVDKTLGDQKVAGYTTVVKVNGTTANASTAKTGDLITVQISVPATKVSWIPNGWFTTGTLQSQFTLARE